MSKSKNDAERYPKTEMEKWVELAKALVSASLAGIKAYGVIVVENWLT